MDRKKLKIISTYKRTLKPEDAAEDVEDAQDAASNRHYNLLVNKTRLGESHPDTIKAAKSAEIANKNLAKVEKTLGISEDRAARSKPITHAKLATEFEKQKKHEEALGDVEDAEESTQHHAKEREKLNVQLGPESPLEKMKKIDAAHKKLMAAQHHENLMRAKVPEPSRNKHVLETIYGKVGSAQRRGEHGGDWEHHANIADQHARKHRDAHARGDALPHMLVTGKRGGTYYISSKGGMRIYTGHKGKMSKHM